MRGMTGYAAHEYETNDAHAAVEIKGYNSRYLDITITMPPLLAPFESEARRLVSGVCKRGRIEVSLRIREKTCAPAVLNHRALDAYIALCGEAARHAGVANTVNVIDLLRCEGVLETPITLDAHSQWNDVKTAIIEAVTKFNDERVREGAFTQRAVLLHLASIEAAHQRMTALVPHVEDYIKTTITRRCVELKIDGVDENKILSEVAFLLMKCTIAEELSRLSGHLAEFRAEAELGGGSGKKLEFLCQEIAREINTIGAKAPLYEITRLVAPVKEAVENIREQLRNIE